MPFGLIFTALVYGILSILFLVGVLNLSAGLRWVEILTGLFLPLIVFGLLRRWGWARWFGAGVGVLLAWLGFVLTATRGGVQDILLLFTGIIAAVVLLVPATGDVNRGRIGPTGGRSVAEILTGLIAVVMLAGVVVLFLIATTRERPSRAVDPAIQSRAGSAQVAFTDFRTGLERAGSEGKPMLVDFYAEWCGPCKEMDRVTFRNGAVVDAIEAAVIAVRVDSEGTESIRGFTGEDLAERYRINSYPTLMLIDANGNVIVRKRGGMGPGQLIAWLESALARYAANPENLENQDNRRRM